MFGLVLNMSLSGVALLFASKGRQLVVAAAVQNALPHHSGARLASIIIVLVISMIVLLALSAKPLCCGV
jgi:hypothetical protein